MLRLATGTLLIGLLTWGCGGNDEENHQPNIPGGDETSTTFKVSECGGFAKLGKSDSSLGYCDAEVLDWSYDAAKNTVTLKDKRVLLNCCGDHSVTVKKQNGTYVITEIDAPEQGNMRCKCMCVFDFEVSFQHEGGGVIAIELVRDTTDDSDPAKTVYSGKLDLSQAPGAEVLDKTDVGPWCESKAPQGPSSQTYAISECGGFEAKSSDWYQVSSYCDAELLKWQRDPASGSVTFTDQRVLLNCCGKRSIAAVNQGGVLEITVNDAPEQGGGRCFCMCVFDFSVTVGKLSGKVPVKLIHDISDDNNPPKVVYSGTLDLTADTGVVIADKSDAGGFCNQP